MPNVKRDGTKRSFQTANRRQITGSQKSKAMDHNALSSKITNLNRSDSDKNKNVKLYNVLRSKYQTFPEISDIPDIH